MIVEVLEQLVGAGRRRLIELPQPALPPGDDKRWEECLRLLKDATQLNRSWDAPCCNSDVPSARSQE